MPRRKLTEEEKAERRERMRQKKEEDRKALVEAGERKKCLSYNTNEPTIFYEVGQNVIMGAHDNAEIVEVLDNGKAYKVRVWGMRNSYGKQVPYENTLFTAWMELLPEGSNNDDVEMLHDEEQVHISYYQNNVSSLLYTHYHFGVDFDPDYQRGNVWTREDKVKLIDSIFKDVDIGKFVLIQRPIEDDQFGYEMLDGKQRFFALMEFFENRFSYRGKFYRDLHCRDRYHFKEYRISRAEVHKVSPKDKYRLFLRLNQGGKEIERSHMERVKELYEKCKDDKSVWS